MHWGDDQFIEDDQIQNFLQTNKYSYHRNENVIAFKTPWNYKAGEILVSTVLLGALILVSSSYNGADSGLYPIYGVEILLYLSYLIYLYRKSTYDLEIDLGEEILSLIPKTEFVRRQTVRFKDIKNFAIRIKEVGYQESPFEGYTLYQKSIYAKVGSRKIDLLSFVSKTKTPEPEVIHLEKYFNKHIIHPSCS